MGLIEWFWKFLPDACEVDDCCRKGMRGNENRIYPWDDIPDFYLIMCDYCNSKYMRGEEMKFVGLPRIVCRPGGKVEDFTYRRRQRAIDKSKTR